MKKILFLFVVLLCISCHRLQKETSSDPIQSNQYLTVLGIAQDGGFPHIGCQKTFCTQHYQGKLPSQKVVSLGLVDLSAKKKFLFEATPDITTQLDDLERNHLKTNTIIDGVFLTHAHIGHYTGLMYFGREALGKKNIPVYAMPKMKSFLESNGPWSQLIALKNIALQELKNDRTIQVSNALKVIPFLVPHRDEFSETVGYKIQGKKKTALFIPDINKWHLWGKNIVEEVKKVDYAFLDATFFKDGEINRPMSEVPHPFIEETMTLFKNESEETKNKVIFIHFNHSNPVMQSNASERKALEKQGFRVAKEGQIFDL